MNEIVIKSKKFEKAKRIIITLHGYGTNGSDFAEVGDIYLSKNIDDAVFLFPDGPFFCDSGFSNEQRQWFFLDKMSKNELNAGLKTIEPILEDYVRKSCKKFDCSEVCFIGFSQGAITAFDMLYLPRDLKISKIVAFSGIFLKKDSLILQNSAKVLISHGEDDLVVPYKNAVESLNKLQNEKINCCIKTFKDIGHSISVEGWESCVEFLNEEY